MSITFTLSGITFDMQSGYLIALSAVLFATAVTAQSSVPACAVNCFASGGPDQTICTPSQLDPIRGCIFESCSVKDGLSAINTTLSTCEIPAQSRQNKIIYTNAIFGVLAALALFVRLLVCARDRVNIDDAFAVAAWVFSLVPTWGMFHSGLLGNGRDTWTVPPHDIYSILKILYAVEFCYLLAGAFTKLCFCMLYLRFFPPPTARKYIYTGIALSVIYPIAFGIPTIVACRPITAYWTAWDGTHPEAHCINQNTFWYVAAVYNILLDSLIIVIPIPLLMKLNLSVQKKLMLVAVFSTGSVTIIVSMIRLWPLSYYGKSQNPLYDDALCAVFSPLEINVGIIALCMISFKRFSTLYLPRLFGDRTTSVGNKYYRQEESPKNSNKRVNTLEGILFKTTVFQTVKHDEPMGSQGTTLKSLPATYKRGQ